jgi:3-hydroxyacyl-[acyl-carrier-protein] dehydratase
MAKVDLDSTEIQKIIPHRYPMLLIDRVEELEPGKMAVAKRNDSRGSL